MILLFQQIDEVLLEDVVETASACDGSDSSGSGTFISSVSDVSSFFPFYLVLEYFSMII